MREGGSFSCAQTTRTWIAHHPTEFSCRRSTFASLILHALEEAEAELIGKAVVLTDGKAGTVVAVSLDELHGLRISIAGHDGKWPVSTIKFVQN